MRSCNQVWFEELVIHDNIKHNINHFCIFFEKSWSDKWIPDKGKWHLSCLYIKNSTPLTLHFKVNLLVMGRTTLLKQFEVLRALSFLREIAQVTSIEQSRMLKVHVYNRKPTLQIAVWSLKIVQVEGIIWMWPVLEPKLSILVSIRLSLVFQLQGSMMLKSLESPPKA